MVIRGGNKRYRPFYNNSGTLTQYAFACGYVQRTNIGSVEYVLYKEHGHYHVVAWNNNADNSLHVGSPIDRMVFDTLSEARKWRVDARKL